MYYNNDPFGELCERIIIVLSSIAMLAALSVYYVYSTTRFKLIFASLALRRVYNEVYFFLLKKGSHLYLRHIEVWLIVFGLKRSKTWAEIEQRRLEVSAYCGYEIPRTPDMEEGLKQEGYTG